MFAQNLIQNVHFHNLSFNVKPIKKVVLCIFSPSNPGMLFLIHIFLQQKHLRFVIEMTTVINYLISHENNSHWWKKHCLSI